MAPESRSMKTASALLLAAAMALGAAAADEPKDEPASGPRVSIEKERVLCADATSRGRCDAGSKTRVVTEQDVTVRIDIKQKPSATCAATINAVSEQRNTSARVTGVLENAQCAASGGEYTLAVTLRGADGERRTLEFPQTWARTDDKPVAFTYDLPIGPDVDLVSVRPRGLKCTCADSEKNEK
jgi:hypothetical protein